MKNIKKQSSQNIHDISQQKLEGQYTYFDSIIKKYQQKKRKNEMKSQQSIIQKQQKQLAKCTFRPAILPKQTMRQTLIRLQQSKQKLKIQQRLIEWGNKRSNQQRKKIIQKQIQQISLTHSLSKQKHIIQKLNRSFQQTQSSRQIIRPIGYTNKQNKSYLQSYKTLKNMYK